MTTSHTPGPWTLAPNCVYGIHVFGPDGGVIAQIQGRDEPQHQANARLIAAAPEMLEALSKISANAAESVEWIRRVADAAIAKATQEEVKP